LLFGCAKAPAGSPTPSASESEPVENTVVTVPTGATPAEKLLGAIAAAAVQSVSGYEAKATNAPTDVNQLIPDMEAAPSIHVDFARTLVEQGGEFEEVPGSEEIPEALAELLGEKISVLQPTALSGSIVWVSKGDGSWGYWKSQKLTDPVAVVPSWAENRSDGVESIRELYSGEIKPNFVVQDDTLARAAALNDGTAILGAFRACDVGEMAGLTPMSDDRGAALDDPVTLMVSTSLTESAPDLVLKVKEVFDALTQDQFNQMEAQVVSGADPAQVAATVVVG
jgi:hypothetical protein